MDQPDLNLAATEFSKTVLTMMALHIPRTGPRAFPMFPKWFSTELCLSFRRKAKLHRRRNSSNAAYDSYSRSRADTARLLDRDKAHEAARLEQIFAEHPQDIYAMCNSKLSPDIALLLPDGSLTSDPIQVADAFVTHYQSIYPPADHVPPETDLSPHEQLRGPRSMFVEADIVHSLRKYKVTRTEVPNTIPSIILKACGDLMVAPLLNLFNRSIFDCHFPDHWKVGVTIPIHKGGSPILPVNYRPVTILPPVAMLFEITAFLHLEQDISVSFPSPDQHGFTRGRSTSTNLADFTAYLSDTVETRGQIDVVYLDISKAFDLMNHQQLATAMRDVGLPTHWIHWTLSYLSNRSYRVKAGQSLSASQILPTSGIAQGSSGGPSSTKYSSMTCPNIPGEPFHPNSRMTPNWLMKLRPRRTYRHSRSASGKPFDG
jgi:hypothetical protein